ncbi:hypothetical protein HNR20_001281 [Micromonospora parathelypteridis]|uniref:NB-ARC domain-containing protein n=1 Tax=Micromonospora parathelypteridis TaxID=1839617 RepID=A0A840VLI4_9ACTN|nr:tetratricopeptide repeat protein [Micromonospora parathelypteridis]MBB5476776.1 hypothetical protein [Micromonospora parathelypteridis]
MTVVVIAAAFALVGNLATNTVQVSGRWWPTVVWTLAGMLVAATLVVEWARHRASAHDEHAADVPGQLSVFGAIPLAAWQFQDRPDEMAMLRRALGGRGRAALVALPGARGAGKTQLAAAFARECVAHDYDLVAWVNAETGPVADLALLAQRLGLGGADEDPEVLAAALRGWLEQSGRARRLVVFDNVDDPDTVRKFLPATGTAKVIITTNRQEFTSMAGISAVPVGMFTPSQGQAFLQTATGLPRGADAAELGVRLGWLPLALAQVAASINRDRWSYRQYLQALEGQNLDEVLRRQAGADHPGVLKATQLSVAGLDRADPMGDASALLRVLSVLSPDGISRKLLARALPALGLSGGLGRALEVLTTASLVSLGGAAEDEHGDDGVVISVHRLTARVIRHQAGTALIEAITTATDALDTLTQDLPMDQAAHRRTELDELVAHILALRGHSVRPSPLLLTLCRWAAESLHDVGDVARAGSLLQATRTDSEAVLGPDHPDTLTTRHHLAALHALTLDPGGAVRELEQLLVDRLRVLGPDHDDTLATRHQLAYARGEAGDPEAAVTALDELLTDLLRIQGPGHPETLGTRNDLAHWHGRAGDPAGAVRALEELLADQVRLLNPGPDHARTMSIQLHLAHWRGMAGDPAGAATAFEELLVDNLRVLGPDHPATLATRRHLANWHSEAGDELGAADALEKLCADHLRVLGPDHPDTLNTQNDLAGVYHSIGRRGQAVNLLETVLANCERALGRDHHLTATVRGNLAFIRGHP